MQRYLIKEYTNNYIKCNTNNDIEHVKQHQISDDTDVNVVKDLVFVEETNLHPFKLEVVYI